MAPVGIAAVIGLRLRLIGALGLVVLRRTRFFPRLRWPAALVTLAALTITTVAFATTAFAMIALTLIALTLAAFTFVSVLPRRFRLYGRIVASRGGGRPHLWDRLAGEFFDRDHRL